MGLPGLPHTATTMKIVEDSGARGQLCHRKATNSNKEGYSTYSRITPYIYMCVYTKFNNIDPGKPAAEVSQT